MKILRAMLLLALLSLGWAAKAQQLDLSDPNLKPRSHPSTHPSKIARSVMQSVSPSSSNSAYYVGKPLSATVSKVRYLPQEMFGQWNIVSQLLNTDDASNYRPIINEIWLLERQGDQLIIINPVTGGHASIAVEKVEGKTTSLTREILVDKRQSIQENFTIRVSGDILTGQSLQKVRTLKNGQVVRETFGVYQIDAKRISQGRAQFRPEASQGPDIEIEELRPRN